MGRNLHLVRLVNHHIDHLLDTIMGKEKQSAFPYKGLLIATSAFLGGVVMGLLLAPRSGRETREYIGQQGEELEQRLRRTGEQVAEQLQESVRQVVEQVVEQVVPPVETNNESRLSQADIEEELERIPKKKSN